MLPSVGRDRFFGIGSKLVVMEQFFELPAFQTFRDPSVEFKRPFFRPVVFLHQPEIMNETSAADEQNALLAQRRKHPSDFILLHR
ncbi:hypothetical protein D3C73_1539700 [compost metagenome]